MLFNFSSDSWRVSKIASSKSELPMIRAFKKQAGQALFANAADAPSLRHSKVCGNLKGPNDWTEK